MVEATEIAICGNFTWDHLAASYKREFELLGHRVHGIDTTRRDEHLRPWLTNRLGKRVAENWMDVRRQGAEAWNDYLVSRTLRLEPEFLLLLKGQWVMPESIEEIRTEGVPVYIFHPDNPFQESPNYRPEFLPCAEVCTSYFIWSRALCGRLRDRGVNVHYHPFGWDPFVFPHGPRPDSYKHEVVFIGGWDEKREHWLSPVAERYDLKIWGPDLWARRTSRDSPVRRAWQGVALRGRDAADVIRHSKVVLNILRRQNLPDGTNMRTFEVSGCGGFLLATDTKGATGLFPNGIAGAYFETIENMIEKIHYYLEHGHLRARIAEAAHDRVKRAHRYRDRAEAILAVHDDVTNGSRYTGSIAGRQ